MYVGSTGSPPRAAGNN